MTHTQVSCRRDQVVCEWDQDDLEESYYGLRSRRAGPEEKGYR